jgi:hypothetical protein
MWTTTLDTWKACPAHLPHLLWISPRDARRLVPVRAWIRSLFHNQPASYADSVLEWNCLLHGGDLETLETQWLPFVQRQHHWNGQTSLFKWLVLDRADALPVPTQFALRRIVETHSLHTRFVLVTHAPETVVFPLHSRLASLWVPLSGPADESFPPSDFQTSLFAELAAYRDAPPVWTPDKVHAQIDAWVAQGVSVLDLVQWVRDGHSSLTDTQRWDRVAALDRVRPHVHHEAWLMTLWFHWIFIDPHTPLDALWT